MTHKLNWQMRSMVILVAVTLIMGIILTTLAVWEVEREKLIRERELNEEQQRYAILLVGEVESLFSEIEEKITTALADPQTLQDKQSLSQACRRATEAEGLIVNIFLAWANGELVLPLKNPDSLSSERKRLAKISLEKIENIRLFKTAESAELAANNLPLAIQSYRALGNSVPDDSIRAIALNRLARCYLKFGEMKLALVTYDKILKSYSHEISSEGVPLGIIAFFQIGNITLKTEESEKTGGIILDFYGRLVGPEWTLDKTQFHLYRGMIRKMSETWSTESKETKSDGEFKNRWGELEKRADQKFKDLEAEEGLIEKIIPLAQTRLFKFNSEPEKFYRFSETVGAELFLICAAAIQEDNILGIHIDNSVLIRERLPQILERFPAPEDWLVQIVDTDGRVISGEEDLVSGTGSPRTPLVLGFAQDFPPWQVSIFHKNPDAKDRQYNMRRNVYILAVMAAMAVFFFGGFMVIRSTAKELELARLKSEFVSTVSHEFRTPLMSIRYLSEMLDSERVKSEGKKKTYYGKIKKESERLSRLIENMLDFSKIETGMKQYRFEDLSIEDLAKEVVDRFKEYVVNKPVTLECEISENLPHINGDKEGISRALFNLLDNAVKYSGKEPVIYFRARDEKDAVFLEVQDLGGGISKDEQKRVFEKFYRSADPAHRNIEGSGIGLTLVEHIVKAHGGEVLLESVVGKGTRMTLKLPVSQKGKEDE
jgi:signal transduction histidine kinase